MAKSNYLTFSLLIAILLIFCSTSPLDEKSFSLTSATASTTRPVINTISSIPHPLPHLRGIPPTPISDPDLHNYNHHGDLDDDLDDHPTLDNDLPLIPNQDLSSDPPNCLAGPDTITFICVPQETTTSPFALCQPHFLPVYAHKLQDIYTICCNETYTHSTVYDSGGFGCCRTRSQGFCRHAESVVGCLTTDEEGRERNISLEVVAGVEVCRSESDGGRGLRDLVGMVGWMVGAWVGCVSLFWGL